MSGTKSASPMAPVTNPAPSALIVAHGQPSKPAPAEAALQKLAQRVNQHLPDWQISSATMAAQGALQQARSQQPDALIYPLFMADGWFTGTALPERLTDDDRNRLLPPLGLDQRLPALALEVLKQRLVAMDWQMEDTCLIIAAHGGQTSKNPAKAARKFADAVGRISDFADIRLGFIEEQPSLTSVAKDAGTRAICLPFFAANGWHVRRDLAAALRTAEFQGETLEAIGVAEQVPALIAQSLTQAMG